MATDKYDLHTIDYSVQGWDTIMTTDMEILDEEVNTRILCTLGETVAVSDALYLNTDGKYYKAQADGTQQPSMGLALETGILDDSIRIQRVGPITDAGWSWGTVGGDLFLSDSVAGELTESEPTTNSQTIGIVLSATSMYISLNMNITVSGGGVSDHSSLNELDYASAGHTGFSPDTHTHDDRYYTESEVDTISGSLNTKIDGKSDTSHTHDDRYYTESEVDTISGSLNTKIDGKIANLSEDTTPELGGQLGVGEYDIKLDALLSADGKYSGTTRDGVLGATLAFGDLVYLNTTDQRWELCDADAETTSGDVDLAIVLAAGNDGDTRLLLTDGYVREDDWNFTSYGQALFVSTTSGTMTQDVSGYTTGDIVRVVGKAGTTASGIHFKPSQTWLELS